MPFSFWYFTVSISCMVGRFVSVAVVVDGGDATGVLGTGKGYQQEPSCLKGRSVFQGINHLKNINWSCVVEIIN
jgi:hypothetical protein